MKRLLVFICLSLMLSPSNTEAVTKATSPKKVSKSAKPAMLLDFSFRGSRIGEPAETVIELIYKQQESVNSNIETTDKKTELFEEISKKVSKERKEEEHQSCLKNLQEKGESKCTDPSPESLGFDNTYIDYYFFDKKFSCFMMSFPTYAHNTIRSMLIGKYGHPHHETVTQVQNGLGASFDQIISTWNTKHGPLELQLRYGDVTHGLLMLEDIYFAKVAADREKKEMLNKGKTAF